MFDILYLHKYKKRSTDLLELIIDARINGESYGEISKKFHISKQGAMKMFKKFQETGFVENLEKKTTPREDLQIIREVQKNQM